MIVVFVKTALLLSISFQISGHDPSARAGDRQRFLEAAASASDWNEPTDPTRIIGPIYFVGTKGLSVWLITTSQGHILLNTGTTKSGPMIESSIGKLGFKPGDIKLLLICHAHFDHVGGLAYLQKISGGQVAVIDKEVELLQSGGKADFRYGRDSGAAFDAVQVNRVLQDGETIKLGDVEMTAHLTAGHTKGTTTWSTKVSDGSASYTVVFPDGTSVNQGYRVVRNPSYPGIGDNYRRTFQTLGSLKPDIWLTPHTDVCNFEGKRARTATEGVRAWVDPEGYKNWLAAVRAKFEAAVNSELRAPAEAN